MRVAQLSGQVLKCLVLGIVCVFLTLSCFRLKGPFLLQSVQLFFLSTFLSLGIAFLWLITTLSRRKQPGRGLGRSSIAFLLLNLYILIHAGIWGAERYFIVYTLSGVLYFLAMWHFFKLGIVQFHTIALLYAGLAVAQSTVCIMQQWNILSSPVPYFPVAGTFNNPNITAMFILLLFPILLRGLSKRKLLWPCLTSLMLCTYALVLLRCRTAWLGLSCAVVCYVIRLPILREYWKTRIRPFRLTVAILFMSLLTGWLIFLFQYKQSSSEGRLLIWKTATTMILDRPVFGHGYGHYERDYNRYQADYLTSGKATLCEKEHARYVHMAYNDYLEQAVQSGIIGLLLFVCWIVAALRASLAQENRHMTVILGTFAGMICVNFGMQAIPVWMWILTCAAYVSTQEQEWAIREHSPSFRCLSASLLCLTVLLAAFQLRQLRNWQAASQAVNKLKGNDASAAWLRLKPVMEASGHIPTYICGIYAHSLKELGKYEQAEAILRAAVKEVPDPHLLKELAQCYTKQGKADGAERTYRQVASMIPTDFEAQYRLMHLLKTSGRQEALRQTASDMSDLAYRHEGKYARLCRNLIENIED